jgi:hypothetical protein
MRRILALGMAACLALAHAAGADEGMQSRDSSADGGAAAQTGASFDEADTQAQAQAMIGRLALGFAPLCAANADVADFTDVIANESAAFSLDAVILALAQAAGDEALCAGARQAARDAQNLAQFAQAAASGDDATGALGDNGEGAPFGFGGFSAPGGAGYI